MSLKLRRGSLVFLTFEKPDRLVPEAPGSKIFEKFDFRPCAGLHFFEFIVNKSARSRQL